MNTKERPTGFNQKQQAKAWACGGCVVKACVCVPSTGDHNVPGRGTFSMWLVILSPYFLSFSTLSDVNKNKKMPDQ